MPVPFLLDTLVSHAQAREALLRDAHPLGRRRGRGASSLPERLVPLFGGPLDARNSGSYDSAYRECLLCDAQVPNGERCPSPHERCAATQLRLALTQAESGILGTWPTHEQHRFREFVARMERAAPGLTDPAVIASQLRTFGRAFNLPLPADCIQ